ncbi:metallo-beta-lactamase domain-containing protein, partial [Cystoisospora suis]
MSFPTKALSPLLLLDCARVGRDRSQSNRMQQLYGGSDSLTSSLFEDLPLSMKTRATKLLLPPSSSSSTSRDLSSSSSKAVDRSTTSSLNSSSSSSSSNSTGVLNGGGGVWSFSEAEVFDSLRRVRAQRLHETWLGGRRRGSDRRSFSTGEKEEQEEEKETRGGGEEEENEGEDEEDEEIQLTPYYAGHVLGAAMYELKMRNATIVYTGDYNTIPDRHLGCASIPCLRPDVLISECTYASFVRASKRTIERDLCAVVHDCLLKGGKVLIPVFAVGRAQELCMLLENYWERMHLQFPIYFAGGMTEKANAYYRLYVHWSKAGMNILSNSNTSDDGPPASAFSFPHILPFQSSLLSSPSPMVLLATPGMLHGGLALKALKAWAGDPDNLVLIPGYCVRGTVGAMLIAGQRQIPLDGGHTILNVKCRVRYMSFSAHADTVGIQQLVQCLQPRHVVLVHGEKEGMTKLANVLRKDYQLSVFTPATGQTISIPIDPPSNLLPVYVHRNFLEAAVEATAAARSPWQPGGFEYSREVRQLIEDCTRGDEE